MLLIVVLNCDHLFVDLGLNQGQISLDLRMLWRICCFLESASSNERRTVRFLVWGSNKLLKVQIWRSNLIDCLVCTLQHDETIRLFTEDCMSSRSSMSVVTLECVLGASVSQ